MIILILVLVFLFYLTKQYANNTPFNKAIKTLTRQSARWGTASTQDKNLLIKTLHANYAAGYLWALQDIATDSQIKQATGVDFQTLKSHIIKIQDAATKQLAATCPNYAPQRTYLTEIGGE